MQTRFNLELQQILDACAEMILLVDPHGKIVYANEATCQATGYSREELIGRPPKILDSPNACRNTLQAMQTCLGAGKPWTGQVLQQRKGNSRDLEYWAEINVSPILSATGSLLGYLQIQRDVSAEVAENARKLQEQQDTQARLKIAKTLASPKPLTERLIEVLEILFDLAGLALQRKGGLFRRRDDGLHLYLLHGQFSEEFRTREQFVPVGECLCGRAALSGKLLVSDDCFCDPRHERRFTNMQAHGHYIVPINHGGQNLGILFLYTDPYPAQDPARQALLVQVGELIALAWLQEDTCQLLEAARDEALKAAQAKAAFLANMSHEIRTPMNGVLGMLELLKETPLTAEQQELVATCYSSAEALLAILNDILDFSKLEAGKLEFETVPFDLVNLVEEALAMLAPRAHAKGLELNLILPPQLAPQRLGDPTRLRQVLVNLIGNAIKFTERGEVTVTVQDLGKRLRFQVQDSGIGIAPEVQAKLFQPFTQADASTTRRFGGTGLGLTICRQLVEGMGGWIEVESALGRGSTFTFELPLPVCEADPSASSAEFAGATALIVDDNATNRQALKSYLVNLGMAVEEAGDALEALSFLTTHPPPQVLLLDSHMPGMDGIGLAKALAAMPMLAQTRRILLSSGKLPDPIERAELKIDACLLKPVRRQHLTQTLTALLCPQSSCAVVCAASDCAATFAGTRVLVAEDNPVNQTVILKLLKRFGIEPTLAANGQEAVERFTQQRFDLVLMDCQMPVLDGYQATRAVRAHERSQNLARTPVIALTAHAGEGEREKCLACGMDDYLAKPVTRQALAQTLARFIGPPKAPAEPVPGYDRALALQQLDGDEALLAELIDLFVAEAPKRLADLENAQRLGDLAWLREAAHALKGMAAQIGATALQAQAAALEQAAKTGAGDPSGEATARLRLALKALLEQLKNTGHG